VIADELDAALFQGLGQRLGNPADQFLLPVDQAGPIEHRLAHADAVDVGLGDLVECVGCGHQHLFRRATAVGTGAAEIARLDHDDLQPGGARRHGDAEPGIAAA